MTDKEKDVALMISDLIGQVAQLELFAKYGIKPTSETMKKMDERYNTYYKDELPTKLEAQVAINTQRDIDMKEVEKPEPEKPKRTWRNIIKLFHDNEPKHKPEGYSHDYRR